MKYKFVIDGRLPGMNEYTEANRYNRYKGAQTKKDAQQKVLICIKKQLKDVGVNAPVKIKYRWYEANAKRDLDNISGFGHKVIQDALVQARVLKDDGWNYIKGFSDEFYIDKNDPRIEVTITEV